MRSILSLLFAALLLGACNNDKGKITITDKTGKTKGTIDVTSMASYAEDMQKKTEDLKKLTPLSTDELKALMPEEIMGMKRSSFDAQSMMGYAMANATYKKEDGDQRIKVTIVDCAGEAGAGFYTLTYYGRMNMVSENENGYTKSVDFNGGKAVEEYKKNNEEYNLTYLGNDRLLVSVEGEKVGLDAVKDVAKSLKLK